MTTLLLTNRQEKSQVIWYVLFGIFGMILFSVFQNGCSHANTQDIPDVVYKARAFLPITSDTTKPKQKVIYNHYKLEGSDTLFQMLWLQVQSPADVTPRNLQKLRDWLQSSIKIDSSGKQ